MTIPNSNRRKQYAGNAATTVFAYNFKILDTSHLKVYVYDVANDIEYLLYEDTHYSVSGEGVDAGGNVTTIDLTDICGTAILPSGWLLTILRNTPLSQLTDLENSGGYYPDTVEEMVDLNTAAIIQLQEEIDRCLKVGASSEILGTEVVEGNYLAHASREVIQDFTVLGNVGSVAQQRAGHIWRHSATGYNEPNTTWATLLAYYKFLAAAPYADTKGSYLMTAGGSPAAADGIMGSDYALEFDGATDYLYNSTLLGTTPTAISIDSWIKPDSWAPAGNQYLFFKQNRTNHYIYCYLGTDGKIYLVAKAGGAESSISVQAPIAAPTYATYYMHVQCVWNASLGLMLWIDGIPSAGDSTFTTLMSSTSTGSSSFFIGCDSSHANLFDGKISLFRVRNQLITLPDIEVAMATEYATPTKYGPTDVNTDRFHLQMFYEPGGDPDFMQELNWSEFEVCRNTSYIYRKALTHGIIDPGSGLDLGYYYFTLYGKRSPGYGIFFNSTDKIALTARY